MPWSEWIQTPESLGNRFSNSDAATSANALEVQAAPGDAATQLDSVRTRTQAGENASTDRGSFSAFNAQQQWQPHDLGNPSLSSAQATGSWLINWHGLRPGQDMRQMFPDELFDLEYGVDYAPRPDRDEFSDPDAYIEYEDGLIYMIPDDIQGWEGSVTLTVANASHVDTAEPWDGAGRAYITDAATLAPPASSFGPIDPPIVPNYGAGTTLVSVNGPNDTTATNSFTLPAGTTDVVVVGEFEFTPFPDADGIYSTDINMSRVVKWRLLFPRWRYWIPREPYVRLLHRGDGLGLSSRRLRVRGNTNQAGRLRGGY